MDLTSKIKNKKKIVTILLSINLLVQILAFDTILSLVSIILSALLVYFVTKGTIQSYTNARGILIFSFIATGAASNEIPTTASTYDLLFMVIMLGILAASFFLVNSIYKYLIAQANSPEVK